MIRAEQIVGRERIQRASHRQLVRNVVDRRRVNSTARAPSVFRKTVVSKRNDSSLCTTYLTVALSSNRCFGRRCIGNVDRATRYALATMLVFTASAHFT